MPLVLRAAAAATTTALALSLTPATPAYSAPPPARAGARASTAPTSVGATTVDLTWARTKSKGKRTHEPRSWGRLTTYRRAILEGCRPPQSDGFRRIVLRVRNAHDKRLRRAEVSFKDRAYSLPWNGGTRTPWVRAGHAAPLARVSTTGRLVTQRVRVRLRTPRNASPVRSLRWTEVPPCERPRRR